jgi:hypothetical protein
MNKIKTTKKEMRQNHFILGVGYCTMQNLLYYYEPVAYSVRLEGWACDYYDIDGIIISMGYSPLVSDNMKTAISTFIKYRTYCIEAYKCNYSNALTESIIQKNKFFTPGPL